MVWFLWIILTFILWKLYRRPLFTLYVILYPFRYSRYINISSWFRFRLRLHSMILSDTASVRYSHRIACTQPPSVLLRSRDYCRTHVKVVYELSSSDRRNGVYNRTWCIMTTMLRFDRRALQTRFTRRKMFSRLGRTRDGKHVDVVDVLLLVLFDLL